MREIKFRGIVITSKEEKDYFIFGNLIRKRKSYFIDQNNGRGLYLVKEDSIGQFTGLKDKNGKEIYEGDVLRYNYHIEHGGVDFFGIVEYHDKILKIGYEQDETRFVGFILCACKGTDEEYYTTIPKLKDIEVIGNIYENPKLLEEKNE